MVVQALGLLPALRSVGFSWRWRWGPRSLGLREIGRLAGWMLCYVAANQVAVFVAVRILTRVAGQGSPSVLAFNNVFLLTMMAHGIVGVSVMTALLPRMSAAAAEGRHADVSADLSRGIRLTAAARPRSPSSTRVLGVGRLRHPLPGRRVRPQRRPVATGVCWSWPRSRCAALDQLPVLRTRSTPLQGNRTAALINLPVVACGSVSTCSCRPPQPVCCPRSA